LALFLATGCATVAPEVKPEPPPLPANVIELVKYEQRTQELLDATELLHQSRQNLEDQKFRLAKICVDYPKHLVCQPQTAAEYARTAFCSDSDFTKHVDAVVQACHQGQCKQVDQAQFITRTDYMRLVQRLPHTLVTFRSANTKLDKIDRRQLQEFAEGIHGTKGYFIIVGRASKDGSWKLNVQLALDRAENARRFLVEKMGIDPAKAGFITYGHAKMYLTSLDAERLSKRRLSTTQANRSALVFRYPCYESE
jgi:outer membrane protein OmpA-like peptidoglycan-associated protein